MLQPRGKDALPVMEASQGCKQSVTSKIVGNFPYWLNQGLVRILHDLHSDMQQTLTLFVPSCVIPFNVGEELKGLAEEVRTSGGQEVAHATWFVPTTLCLQRTQTAAQDQQQQDGAGSIGSDRSR